MAAHHGNEGEVKVGTTAVACVQSWSYEESDPAMADTWCMGDTEVTHLASGAVQGSGSVSCYWSESDAGGQDALTLGATVTLNLYPEGDSATNRYYTGDVVIESVSRSGSKGDITTAEFGFRGVLTQGTVSA